VVLNSSFKPQKEAGFFRKTRLLFILESELIQGNSLSAIRNS